MVAVRDLRDEARHIDAGRARNRAGSRRVCATALQTAVGFDDRLRFVQGRVDLVR
jgi:hypothetical protein